MWDLKTKKEKDSHAIKDSVESVQKYDTDYKFLSSLLDPPTKFWISDQLLGITASPVNSFEYDENNNIKAVTGFFKDYFVKNFFFKSILKNREGFENRLCKILENSNPEFTGVYHLSKN